MISHVHALPQGYPLQEYTITGTLGFGGFGITYSARDTNLDKVIAIKEYLPSELAVRMDGSTVSVKSEQDRGSFDWGLERFLDEAKTVAKFDHPNLVRIYRFFEQNGTGYIVMEFIEGRTLSAVLREKGTLDEAEIRAWLWPVMKGLKIVHDAGYLHRDIKPPNIMMRDDGRPCLLDFGAARMAMGGMTRSLTAIMTPGFAPLEQYQTRGRQGPWTDIYSLGAVMYGCISGKKPMDALDRISEDSMESADQNSTITYSKGLINGITAALSMRELDRPQSINALLEILDKPEEEPTRKLHDQQVVTATDVSLTDVLEGDDADVEVSLADIPVEVKSGGFSIKARPENVKISINDDFEGTTPLNLSNLKSGEVVKISAAKEGFETESRSVCVPADGVFDLVFELTRIREQTEEKLVEADSDGKEPTRIMPDAVSGITRAQTMYEASASQLNPEPSSPIHGSEVIPEPGSGGARWTGENPVNTSLRGRHLTKLPLFNEQPKPETSHKSEFSTDEAYDGNTPAKDTADVLLIVGKWLIILTGVLLFSVLAWFKWTDHVNQQQKASRKAIASPNVLADRKSKNSTGTGFSLTIIPYPLDAQIRILNIKQPYQPGILLEPGQYEVEVSKAGFKTKRQWIEIRDRNFNWETRLVKN